MNCGVAMFWSPWGWLPADGSWYQVPATVAHVALVYGYAEALWLTQRSTQRSWNANMSRPRFHFGLWPAATDSPGAPSPLEPEKKTPQD